MLLSPEEAAYLTGQSEDTIRRLLNDPQSGLEFYRMCDEQTLEKQAAGLLDGPGKKPRKVDAFSLAEYVVRRRFESLYRQELTRPQEEEIAAVVRRWAPLIDCRRETAKERKKLTDAMKASYKQQTADFVTVRVAS